LPKSRPTQVIVHRIELQDTERAMAEKFVTGKTIEAVGKGAYHVSIAGAVIAGTYVSWWCLEKVYGWMGDAGDYFSILNQKVGENIADPANMGEDDGTPPTILWLARKLGLRK